MNNLEKILRDFDDVLDPLYQNMEASEAESLHVAIAKKVAQQQEELLEKIEKEVIGKGNEILPPIEAQPYLWAERNARNYLRAEQREKLESLKQDLTKTGEGK